MRFGGTPPQPAGDGPDDLDAMDALTFSRQLDMWVTEVWTHRPEVPRDQSELDAFEKLALSGEFRRCYSTHDWQVLGRGATVEETWLGTQLRLQAEMRCLLSDAFSGLSTPRMSRKTLMQPQNFVDSLRRWLTYPRPECAAMVATGPTGGHTVMLVGVENETGWIRIRDLWPVRSLLAAENNSTGITACPEAGQHWLVDPEQLVPSLAAVIVEEKVWQSWAMYDEFTALQTEHPESGWDGVDLASLPWHPGVRPAPSAEEMAFEKACNYLSAHESHAGAVAEAAWRYGILLSSRGEPDEAVHWFRQAAMIGKPEAADRLVAELESKDPYEADFWRIRRRDEPAAIPDSGPTAVFQQLPNWRAGRAGADFQRGLDQLAEGRPDAAIELFNAVCRSGDKEAAAYAANEIGLLLRMNTDNARAAAALLDAGQSGFFTPSAHAWANLGGLLEDTGDQQAAERAYRKAVATGHYDVTAAVAFALARNLQQAGRIDEATTYYEHAIYSNDKHVSPDAAAMLAALLTIETDDFDRAAYLMSRALESEDAETVAMARYFLGESEATD
jgi:Tfp pilus assembly protein PilF